MLVDLLTEVWPSKAADTNQASLTNMYLEVDETQKGKYKVIALKRRGQTLFCNTGTNAPIRSLYSMNSVLYCISGNKFGSISSGGIFTQLGSNLNTSSGRTKIRGITGGSDTNHQLFMIDGTNGYQYNIGTSTATFPITDSNFPQTAMDIENQDDYGFAVPNSSMEMKVSTISDLTSWPSLSFQNKYGQPDNINAIFSHESMLWLMGDKTSEIWYNAASDATAPNPFQRTPTTFLHYGISAKDSVAVNGNYFIFLSSNIMGGYSFLQTLPRIYYYNPTPISNPPIDLLLGQFSTVSDCIGSIHNVDGHEFYKATFPTANKTFIYDIPKIQTADAKKGAWYYETSYNASNGTYNRSIENCSAFCYGKHLIGDNTGNIYYLDPTNYTDNGNPIQCQFVSPPGTLFQGQKRVFVKNLIIDVQTGIGSNKTFTLEKSLDNGTTWNLINTYTVPNKGTRIKESQLGSTRSGMLFRITTTMDANFAILGFQADITVGHS